MKKSLTLFAVALCAIGTLRASTPEQEKTFVESYKKALQSGDQAALAGFLYTKGAEAEQIEFFTMMLQTVPPTATIVSIDLVTPTAEEIERYSKPMEMPDGKKYAMPFPVSKQLVIVAETKDENGSGKQTSKAPVGEVDGKLVIPVPVLAK